MVPDPYGDWARRAVAIAEERFPGGKGLECILASGPPNSVYLVGLKLAERWRLPLIIDMRDPWERSSLGRPPLTHWHRQKIKAMEEAVYARASVIIANTEGNAADLRRIYPQWADKVIVVPNGFDPDDLNPEYGPQLRKPGEPPDTVHFLYLGGIRGVVRGRLFEGDFLQAVSDYLSRYPNERSRLRIHFVGGTAAEVSPIASSFGLEDICRAYGVVPSNAVGRPLAEADVYVLLLPPNPGTDRGWVPSKLYYYLAGGHPIYAVIHEGTAYDLLQGARVPVEFASPGNRHDALDALIRVIQYVRKKGIFAQGIPAYAMHFDRREIARQLAIVLDRVCRQGAAR